MAWLPPSIGWQNSLAVLSGRVLRELGKALIFAPGPSSRLYACASGVTGLPFQGHEATEAYNVGA